MVVSVLVEVGVVVVVEVGVEVGVVVVVEVGVEVVVEVVVGVGVINYSAQQRMTSVHYRLR